MGCSVPLLESGRSSSRFDKRTVKKKGTETERGGERDTERWKCLLPCASVTAAPTETARFRISARG